VTPQDKDFTGYLRRPGARPDVHYQEWCGKYNHSKRKKIAEKVAGGGIA
jgi:hypothetical protein